MADVVRLTRRIDHPSEHLTRGLASAVEGALWRFDPIRQTKTLINVDAAEGVVTLRGNVRSDMMRSVASRLATRVPGVVRVVNRLVSDSRIESDVAIAIAMDPEVELSTDSFAVKSYLGRVHLSGVVADPDLATAETRVKRIEELAAGVEGVSEVISRLRAFEGSGADAYAAPEAEVEEAVEEVVGARAMGTLLSEDKRNKVRAWIQARDAARAAVSGEGGSS